MDDKLYQTVKGSIREKCDEKYHEIIEKPNERLWVFRRCK